MEHISSQIEKNIQRVNELYFKAKRKSKVNTAVSTALPKGGKQPTPSIFKKPSTSSAIESEPQQKSSLPQQNTESTNSEDAHVQQQSVVPEQENSPPVQSAVLKDANQAEKVVLDQVEFQKLTDLQSQMHSLNIRYMQQQQELVSSHRQFASNEAKLAMNDLFSLSQNARQGSSQTHQHISTHNASPTNGKLAVEGPNNLKRSGFANGNKVELKYAAQFDELDSLMKQFNAFSRVEVDQIKSVVDDFSQKRKQFLRDLESFHLNAYEYILDDEIVKSGQKSYGDLGSLNPALEVQQYLSKSTHSQSQSVSQKYSDRQSQSRGRSPPAKSAKFTPSQSARADNVPEQKSPRKVQFEEPSPAQRSQSTLQKSRSKSPHKGPPKFYNVQVANKPVFIKSRMIKPPQISKEKLQPRPKVQQSPPIQAAKQELQSVSTFTQSDKIAGTDKTSVQPVKLTQSTSVSDLQTSSLSALQAHQLAYSVYEDILDQIIQKDCRLLVVNQLNQIKSDRDLVQSLANDVESEVIKSGLKQLVNEVQQEKNVVIQTALEVTNLAVDDIVREVVREVNLPKDEAVQTSIESIISTASAVEISSKSSHSVGTSTMSMTMSDGEVLTDMFSEGEHVHRLELASIQKTIDAAVSGHIGYYSSLQKGTMVEEEESSKSGSLNQFSNHSNSKDEPSFVTSPTSPPRQGMQNLSISPVTSPIQPSGNQTKFDTTVEVSDAKSVLKALGELSKELVKSFDVDEDKLKQMTDFNDSYNHLIDSQSPALSEQVNLSISDEDLRSIDFDSHSL
ncbi:hypothetical protein MP228_010844 [Amoeboaphelidium protococcarum]|nr:hypothetical protein MP228_010844 [Amoeboaphelidium protococcarum]